MRAPVSVISLPKSVFLRILSRVAVQDQKIRRLSRFELAEQNTLARIKGTIDGIRRDLFLSDHIDFVVTDQDVDDDILGLPFTFQQSYVPQQQGPGHIWIRRGGRFQRGRS